MKVASLTRLGLEPVLGDAEKVSDEKNNKLYQDMSSYLKILYHTVQEQGVPIDFEKYCEKAKRISEFFERIVLIDLYSEITAEFKQGKEFKRPDYVGGWMIKPNYVQFSEYF